MRAGTHLYTYCAVRGAPSARALSALRPMPGGSPPRALPLHDDIVVVVADVPADDYNAVALEAKLKDLDWVSICGAAHHVVVDKLARRHVVVPFRLFTIFSSEARAVSTLGRMKARITAALNRVEGRAEWVLRISRPDQARAKGSTTRSAAEGRGQSARARGAVSPRPSGTAFLRAKAAAKEAEAERTVRVHTAASDVLATLKAIADESSARAVEPGTGLILDAAFLVSGRRTARFKKTLGRAAAGLLRDGCRVSLTGPWPAYSFVALTSSPGP